jgi:16S rRNA (cytidine1402-2'-O)-methyltransferase
MTCSSDTKGVAQPGTLYLVATPIGNLEDITYRAVRVLREVDVIACEDTRHTRKLLDRYGISTPTVSYHEHNEEERAKALLERLLHGTSVALVSDAGTPLVSDPGYRLVNGAIEHRVPVEPLPGPSAVLAALAASGLPTDAFHFGGFLPSKSTQRRRVLETLKDEQATLAFYEAPHRIIESLADIEVVLGPRRVVIAREITKVHQEFLRGLPAELRGILEAWPAIKGEITVLIAKGTPLEAGDETPLPEAVAELVGSGIPRMDAIKTVARRRGLSKREVYDAVENSRKHG